jgi:hypothetical protein
MADRPVRLGDVVDDYCLRCRLLLNHDVASLMNAEIAKVTCRTCYTTHDYRKGDVPKRKSTKKKDDKSKLIAEVLSTMPMPPPPSPAPAPPEAREEAPPPPLKKKRDLWAELERISKKK